MLRFVIALLLVFNLFQVAAAQQLTSISSNSLEPNNSRDEFRGRIHSEADYLDRHFRHLQEVIRYVQPSIVHVETTTESENGFASGSVDEAGSGTIFRHGEKWFVLTNRHVINQSPLERVRIYLEDGRVIRARRILSDRETDVAVIEINAQRLVSADIGDSSTVQVGERVIAVGSPFGLSHSVSYGIVSAIGRRNLQLGRQGLKLQNFFQTDAAINPGNSGGPLVNLRGEVVGLNTAIASNSGGNDGIGFAIPIHSALSVAHQLIDEGSVSRAFFGVRMDADFGQLAAAEIGLYRARGARVTGITPGSPAENSGILPGDVITKFYGQEVEDDLQLINIVSLCPLNVDVPIEIFRDGRHKTISVRLEPRGKFDSK